MTISIVVPVHNEAENIQPLLDEIVVALVDFDAYEIIYINDGSSDATAQALAKAQKKSAAIACF
jgi:dolichol-phosphate mannosyltransferase